MNEEQNTKPSGKKKWIKRSIYALLLVTLIPVALAVYVYMSRDRIKQQVLEQINLSLKTDIRIQQIGIDFYHNFPRVSLDLQEVTVADAFNSQTKLIEAQHVYIGFNLIDIFNHHYRIRKIYIDSGSVHVFVTNKGRPNYLIYQSDSSSSKEPFLLNLEEIEFTKVAVVYDNRNSKQFYEGLFHEVNCALVINDQSTNMKCSGSLLAQTIKVEKTTWVREKEIKLKGGFEYQHKNNKFTLQTTNLSIDALHLVLTGDIVNAEKYTDVNIIFKAKEAGIQSLLAVLPFKSNLSNDWKSEGDVYFAGSLKGRNDARQSPAIHINFGVSDGKLVESSKGITIQQIACKGVLDYSKGKGSIKLNPLQCRMDESDFSGSLQLTDFSNPLLSTTLTCHVNANDLLKLSGIAFIKDADGKIDAQLKLNGRLADFKNNIEQVTTSGEITMDLEDISFRDFKEDIELLKADIKVNGEDFIIQTLQSTFEKSDISISGKLLNVFGYLFHKQQLVADVKYHSNFIDLRHFMLPTSTSDNKEQSAPFALPANIRLKADASIDELVYNQFKGKQVSGSVEWVDNHIDLRNLKAIAFNGNINGSCQLNASADGRFLISGEGKLAGVNITEVFKQCNNFSQEELTDQHLKGLLTCTFDMTSVWSNQWVYDPDRFFLSANLAIQNGEILNYAPLQKLSRFASIDDLKNLRFASLKNTIDIRGRVITIPEMDVMNNALNLNLAGTHTFSNELDYHLKIKLSELLRKKRKPVENEFGEEEESGKGMYLYLTMKGPANNLKIAYDKIGVKNKIKQDLSKEKENIKEVLKKELGIGKDTTIKEKQTDSDELEFEAE